MCGINGIFAYHGAANAPDERELVSTRDHMRSRGPDGWGLWWNSDRRLGLGHRRLSIIDLADRAAQPMCGDGSQHVVVFNGEIYNFPELRGELEALGRRFRTTSDTEVLLHLYALLGPDMVHRLRGMYAFAIWDVAAGGLFLARDPYGIKPLYTADDGWTFRFASQVKALLAGGKVSRAPEPAGIAGFCLFGSVPEPFTLYRDIRALPAGHTQWIDVAGPRRPQPFASVARVLAQGALTPAPRTETNARVRTAALSSVRAHCVGDVDVGLFLSAGVDSGALLGLMRDSGQEKIRALTLGFGEFRETADDETPLAAKVARGYGAEHIVRWVDEREFWSDLPTILEAMDQPSIDGVNVWFVAKAAREAGLKVALSGLGGDELFAGYPSFRDIPRWVRWLGPPALAPGLGTGLRRLGSRLKLSRQSPKALGLVEFGGTYPGAYLVRRGLFLPFDLPTLMDPDMAREGLRRLRPLSSLQATILPDPGSPTRRVCGLESANYLRNQLLRDADWAGMAHSVEIRAPWVDYDLLGALAPCIDHLAQGNGKRAQAAAPSTPLGQEQVDRPKTGFGIPTEPWFARTMGQRPDQQRGKGLTSRAWAVYVLAAQRAEPPA